MKGFVFCLGRTKGTAPRKALAQIQNVQQAKNVKFEGVKPSMKPLMQHGKLKTLTPSSKGLKINTPGNRSAVRSKTPFKIHQDNVETKSKVENTVQPKHESVAEKEYMPPNTDRGDFLFCKLFFTNMKLALSSLWEYILIILLIFTMVCFCE